MTDDTERRTLWRQRTSCGMCGAPTAAGSPSGLCRSCVIKEQRRTARKAPPYFWHPQMACRHADPELWFPNAGDHEQSATAKNICLGCPARMPCLEYAMHHPAQPGIWGGLSPDDRMDLKAGRTTVAKVDARTDWQMHRMLNPSKKTLQQRARRQREAGHGTHSNYSHGCRCELCRQAQRDYQRRYRAAGTSNSEAAK